MTFIGQRVKARREELGISQTVLAKRIGVSGPSLSQLESGKIKRSRRMSKLAAVLKVSTEWLEGSADGKPAAPAGAAKAPAVAAKVPVAAKPNGTARVDGAAKTNGAARAAAGRPHARTEAVPDKVMRLAETLLPLPANKLKALFILADIR
jgi:transcriptional regulator with XRE-family HTH domain